MTEIRETVLSAQAGDAHAFETLFSRALPRLRAFIRVRAGDAIMARESVSDVAQSVCREALAELDDFEFRGEKAFRAHLFQRAARKLLKRGRFHAQQRRAIDREVPASGHTAELVATDATPSRRAGAREQLESLEALLGELPEPQREAIAMSRLLGMSYPEIADELDRSESAVRGLVARGLSLLSRRWDDEVEP